MQHLVVIDGVIETTGRNLLGNRRHHSVSNRITHKGLVNNSIIKCSGATTLACQCFTSTSRGTRMPMIRHLMDRSG